MGLGAAKVLGWQRTFPNMARPGGSREGSASRPTEVVLCVERRTSRRRQAEAPQDCLESGVASHHIQERLYARRHYQR